MVKEYLVAGGDNLDNMIKAVNECVEQGFTPFGSPYLEPDHEAGDGIRARYNQAMVMHEEPSYQLLCSNDPIHLTNEVNEYLKKGYKALGGVAAVSNTSQGALSSYITYAQAVARQ